MVFLRRCQLAPVRLVAAWMATAGTAAPAPAPAPSTHNGGDPVKNSAASAKMTISPGTMNAAPPASAPGRPRSRHAQKIASWVEAGPGSRLQAAIASSKSCASSHPRRSTHSSRSSLMWVGGPPNPMQPMRPHSRKIVTSDTRPASGGSRVASGAAVSPGGSRAAIRASADAVPSPGAALGTGESSPPGAPGFTSVPESQGRSSHLLDRCPCGRRADAGEQEPDTRLQLGGHALEGRVGALAGTARGDGVGNAPVDLLGAAGKLRTHLPHPVTQRDHVVEALVLDGTQMLRRPARQVDPVLPQHSHRIGMQWLGTAARAGHLDLIGP